MRPTGTFHPLRPAPTARVGSLLRVLQSAVYHTESRGDRTGRTNRKFCEDMMREHAALLEEITAHPGLAEFAATCHAPWSALRHHTERAVAEGALRKVSP